MNHYIAVLLVLCGSMAIGVEGFALRPVFDTCASKDKIRHFLTFFERVNNNTNDWLERADYNNTAGRLVSVANYSKYKMIDFSKAGGIVDQAYAVFPKIIMHRTVYVLAAAILSGVNFLINDLVTQFANVMFKAFDFLGTGDDFVNLEEMAGMWATFGRVVPPDDPAVKECMAGMDTIVKDGKLSKDEFIAGGVCFFKASGPGCGCFLGPDDYQVPDSALTSALTFFSCLDISIISGCLSSLPSIPALPLPPSPIVPSIPELSPVLGDLPITSLGLPFGG